MKEGPILYSTDNVRAILDGRKTQTRRVIKPQPPEDAVVFAWFAPEIKEGKAPEGCWYEDKNGLKFHCKCPYGQIGDRLWVRETLFRHPYLDEAGYLADETPVFINQTIGDMAKWQWRKDILPSIFMPRWASRITLEITRLRVERLQDISEEEAEAEGIVIEKGDYYRTCKGKFHQLWDSLNAKRGFGWETNPWVWVIEFIKVGK